MCNWGGTTPVLFLTPVLLGSRAKKLLLFPGAPTGLLGLLLLLMVMFHGAIIFIAAMLYSSANS